MAQAKRVVILISGRGSNMVNLIRCAERFSVAAVLSNREDAPGLVSARELGVQASAFPRRQFGSVGEQKRALFEATCELNPDFVALAGYMQIVEPYFVDYFRGRLINIHPALLPKYPGLDTHARALASGDACHGCSVHFVDEGVDTGAIIAQASVSTVGVRDEHDLSERVLAEEHRIYPWVMNHLASGAIELRDSVVRYRGIVVDEASGRGFTLPHVRGEL